MRSPPAPLRFLIAVAAGWTMLRAAAVMTLWLPVPVAATPVAPQPNPARPAVASLTAPPFILPVPVGTALMTPNNAAAIRLAAAGDGAIIRAPALPISLSASEAPPAAGIIPSRPAGLGAPPASPTRSISRWAGYAWLFGRRGDGPGLAPGGTLGGSQAGVRLSYRLTATRGAGLALYARVAAPTTRPAAAEAALGLDWQPSRKIPVHVVAERRQALAGQGQSGFAFGLYGGVSDEKLGAFRLDAWGQTGVVGAKSRNLFTDGSIRLSLPLGRRLKVGAGTWGAAQPGAARFDAGPQASLRIGAAGHAVTLSAEWRFRLAGRARPGSGPALSIASGF